MKTYPFSVAGAHLPAFYYTHYRLLSFSPFQLLSLCKTAKSVLYYFAFYGPTAWRLLRFLSHSSMSGKPFF